MKKVLLFLAAVAFVAAFASCKKECTCITKVTGSPVAVPDVTQTVETKEKCSDLNTEVTVAGLTTKMTCE